MMNDDISTANNDNLINVLRSNDFWQQTVHAYLNFGYFMFIQFILNALA